MNPPLNKSEPKFDNHNEKLDVVHNKFIYKTLHFSAENTGLTKLIFDNENLCIEYCGLNANLSNVNISPSTQYFDNLIEDTYIYERSIFPIWLIRGTINGENKGTINGIIRPKLITSLSGQRKTRIITDATPEFHFYLQDSVLGYFEGQSSHIYNHEKTTGLNCGIRTCSKNNIKEITPEFSTHKVFSEHCNMYYLK